MQNIKNKIPRKDLLAGGIFLIFSLAMLAIIIPFAVPVSFVPPGQISPRFLPEVLSAAILVISALMLILPLMSNKTLSAKQTYESAGKQQKDSSFLKFAPLFSMAAIVISYLLLIWFGFITCSIFSMIAIMFAFGERNIPRLAIISVIITALVWLFAVKLLNIPIP